MARVDWNIHARAHSCQKCGRDFAKGDTCRSAVVLFDTPLVRDVFAKKLAEEKAAAEAGETVKEHPDYIRIDFCDDCWKAIEKNKDIISAWKSVYEPVQEESSGAKPITKETTESLLRRLIESDDAENHLAPIYLLAVMLERKRILVERAIRHAPDGSVVHFYEHRRSGDILMIMDPYLTDEQIPETQAQIERLLGLKPSLPTDPLQEATPSESKPKRFNAPLSGEALAEISAVATSGGMLLLPTDTVYGIATIPGNADALAKIVAAKHRDPQKPCQLLASSIEDARNGGIPFTGIALKLAESFWPGALTIVVTLPDGSSEGVRVPADETARAVCKAAGGLLRCTSANESGKEPAVTIEEAIAAIPEADIAINGGTTKVGLASTVVKIDSEEAFTILREGAISREALEAVLYPEKNDLQ